MEIIIEVFNGRLDADVHHLQSGAGEGGGWSEKERGGAGQEVGRPRELH